MKEHRSLLDILFSWPVLIVLAIAIALSIRFFVVEFFIVPTASMVDTIQEGDRVVCIKVNTSTNPGDIVLFDDPMGSGNVLIKRVIATGGQTVDLVDGQVVVDGTALDETYTEGKRSEAFSETFPGVEISYPYTVPDGYIWVMGDNRTVSRDSRYFGPIPLDSVIGNGVWTCWPLSSWGPLE